MIWNEPTRELTRSLRAMWGPRWSARVAWWIAQRNGEGLEFLPPGIGSYFVWRRAQEARCFAIAHGAGGVVGIVGRSTLKRTT